MYCAAACILSLILSAHSVNKHHSVCSPLVLTCPTAAVSRAEKSSNIITITLSSYRTKFLLNIAEAIKPSTLVAEVVRYVLCISHVI